MGPAGSAQAPGRARMGNRRTAVWSKQPLHCLCRGWGHGGGKTDPDPGNSRKAGLERGREKQRAVVRPHNQTRSSCSSAHHHPVTKSSWWALWMEMHLTVDGRCIQAASPLGNYKTELYDPVMEKYQPSPQWINLFVFVKDPENKVRQALTPCSPAPFTGPLPSTPALRGLQYQCLVLPSPPFLRRGTISSQAGGLKEGHAVCKL